MAYIPTGWAIGALFLRMRLGLEWGRSINASLWMKLASSFLASAIGWLAISHSWLRDFGIRLNLQAPAVFMTYMPDQPSVIAYARSGVIWAAVAAFNSLVELLVLRVGWGVEVSGRSVQTVLAANLVTIGALVVCMRLLIP